jgi:hypothetical protein
MESARESSRGRSAIAGFVAVLLSVPVTALLLAVAVGAGMNIGEGIQDFPLPMVFLWGLVGGFLLGGPGAFVIGAATNLIARRSLDTGSQARQVIILVVLLSVLAGTVYGGLLAVIMRLSGDIFPWAFLPVAAMVGAFISLVSLALVFIDDRAV